MSKGSSQVRACNPHSPSMRSASALASRPATSAPPLSTARHATRQAEYSACTHRRGASPPAACTHCPPQQVRNSWIMTGSQHPPASGISSSRLRITASSYSSSCLTYVICCGSAGARQEAAGQERSACSSSCFPSATAVLLGGRGGGCCSTAASIVLPSGADAGSTAPLPHQQLLLHETSPALLQRQPP